MSYTLTAPDWLKSAEAIPAKYAEAAESFRLAISLLPVGDPKRESLGRALLKCEEALAGPQSAPGP
jgi:hypothetical protein